MYCKLSRLRNKNGTRITKPKPIECMIGFMEDEDKIIAFRTDHRVTEGKLKFPRLFKIDADGIFLRGAEEIGYNKYILQEWFLKIGG